MAIYSGKDMPKEVGRTTYGKTRGNL